MGVKGKVEKGAGAQDHQQDIVPGNVVFPDMRFLHRIKQISHDNHQSQEAGHSGLLKHVGK